MNYFVKVRISNEPIIVSTDGNRVAQMPPPPEFLMLRIFVSGDQVELTHMLKGAAADGPARYFGGQHIPPIVREKG